MLGREGGEGEQVVLHVGEVVRHGLTPAAVVRSSGCIGESTPTTMAVRARQVEAVQPPVAVLARRHLERPLVIALRAPTQVARRLVEAVRHGLLGCC